MSVKILLKKYDTLFLQHVRNHSIFLSAGLNVDEVQPFKESYHFECFFIHSKIIKPNVSDLIF